jgi:hypothetical protein
MELLPPVGWADVARQRDLDHLAARLELRFDAIDQRFDGLDQRFDGLDQRFDGLDQRFATRDDLHEQTTRFIGWMVASNATLVATVALIVSLVTTLR